MKLRLDKLLVERGLATSRGEAARLIEQGRVLIAGDLASDPSQKLPDSTLPTITAGTDWVSRGAFKLLGAIDAFDFSIAHRRAVDIGASTGGFTQVLLEHDVASVVAVDVGSGQFHANLRRDPRVDVREQTDARTVIIDPAPQLLVCDASFISLTKLLPNLLAQASNNADLIALIKPQFEVGPGQVNGSGIVKNPKVAQRAIDDVITWMEDQPDWHFVARANSPIRGGDGNQEVLMHAKKTA